MTTYFAQELETLKGKLRTMAGLAAIAVNDSIKALVARDDALARRVEADDTQLDRLEIEVDEMAVTLLAKAPLATDLRLIIVAMKASHDLERVGDEATAISRRALELNQEPPLKPYVDIPRMAAMALEMLRESLDAFMQSLPAQARAVIPRDLEVDALYRQLERELVSFILENPANTTRCLNLMSIAKRLERIADHATNIAEEVVYLYEAVDIRHTDI
jgi:phosphate transport system protein